MPMTPFNRKEAFKSAVDRLIAEEDETVCTDMYCYAKTVVASFEEIQSLRTKGVRFDKICKLFETTGLLPENANIHSLRQAFAREKAKRSKIGGHEAQETKKRVEVENGVRSREKETTKFHSPAPRTSGVLSVPNRSVGTGAGLEVKPDNTFTIKPIDPDDLPVI